MRTRRVKVVLCLVILLIAFGVWSAYVRDRKDQQDHSSELLIQAILHRDIAEAMRLLAQGADANARDLHPQPQRQGSQPVWPTALMLAATGARLDSRCSDYPNVSINDRQDYDLTGGSSACTVQDKPALVQVLLDHGADINAVGEGGVTALSIAYAWGNVRIVRLLLNRGAKTGTEGSSAQSPLKIAVSNTNVPLTTFLLNRGTDMRSSGNRLEYLLVIAAQGGDLIPEPETTREAMLTLLLYHGAKINTPGYDANGIGPVTPLLEATSFKNTAQVEFLLRHGADVNLRSPLSGVSEIDTPLGEAAARGDLPTLRLLLNHGANINGGARNNFRPLQAVLYNSYSPPTNVVRFLILHGANVNLVGAEGWTPLMLSRSHPEIAQVLLAHGAKVNAHLYDGTTALLYAARGNGAPGGTAAVVRLLLAHGADPAARDKKGRTALMLATDPDVRQALTHAPAHQ